MPRDPIATGRKRLNVVIEVTFNGHSGDLPQRLEEFLATKHSRGARIVKDGTMHYFRGEYTPKGAQEIIKWFRSNGVVFPRKRADE